MRNSAIVSTCNPLQSFLLADNSNAILLHAINTLTVHFHLLYGMLNVVTHSANSSELKWEQSDYGVTYRFLAPRGINQTQSLSICCSYTSSITQALQATGTIEFYGRLERSASVKFSISWMQWIATTVMSFNDGITNDLHYQEAGQCVWAWEPQRKCSMTCWWPLIQSEKHVGSDL